VQWVSLKLTHCTQAVALWSRQDDDHAGCTRSAMQTVKTDLLARTRTR